MFIPYVKVVFQDFAKIFSQFSLHFGKLETATFKDHHSAAASENSYEDKTVGTYSNLPVSCLGIPKPKMSDWNKKGTTSF